MEKSKMINREKKIVAVALSLAMMLPLTFSQTATTGAATKTNRASGTTSQAASANESAYLQLAADSNSGVPMERGDKFTLTVKAKKAFQSAMSVEGTFTYKEDSVTTAHWGDCFEIAKVELGTKNTNWGYSYDNDTGAFAVVSNSTQGGGVSFASSDEIAKITFEVKSAVDKVDFSYTLSNFKVEDSTLTSTGNTNVDEGTNNKEVTVSVTNSAVSARKVTFEMPATIEAKVSQNFSAGKELEVPVTIKKDENSGFNTIIMKFTYPATSMQYKGFEMSPKARTYLSCVTERTDYNGGIYLCFAGKDDTKITGDFITLKFLPMQSSVGQTDTITGSITEIYNVSKKSPTVTPFSSTISFVKGLELGNVNMDSKINLIDVTYALQFYNEVRKDLTLEQQDLADVNRDGKVTLVDVLLLMKYCNGEINSF